jgi:hypothetical protein
MVRREGRGWLLVDGCCGCYGRVVLSWMGSFILGVGAGRL